MVNKIAFFNIIHIRSSRCITRKLIVPESYSLPIFKVPIQKKLIVRFYKVYNSAKCTGAAGCFGINLGG